MSVWGEISSIPAENANGLDEVMKTLSFFFFLLFSGSSDLVLAAFTLLIRFAFSNRLFNMCVFLLQQAYLYE